MMKKETIYDIYSGSAGFYNRDKYYTFTKETPSFECEVSPGGKYSNIDEALDAGYRNIFIHNGTYDITKNRTWTDFENKIVLWGESSDSVFINFGNFRWDFETVQTADVASSNIGAYKNISKGDTSIDNIMISGHSTVAIDFIANGYKPGMIITVIDTWPKRYYVKIKSVTSAQLEFDRPYPIDKTLDIVYASAGWDGNIFKNITMIADTESFLYFGGNGIWINTNWENVDFDSNSILTNYSNINYDTNGWGNIFTNIKFLGAWAKTRAFYWPNGSIIENCLLPENCYSCQGGRFTGNVFLNNGTDKHGVSRNTVYLGNTFTNGADQLTFQYAPSRWEDNQDINGIDIKDPNDGLLVNYNLSSKDMINTGVSGLGAPAIKFLVNPIVNVTRSFGADMLQFSNTVDTKATFFIPRGCEGYKGGYVDVQVECETIDILGGATTSNYWIAIAYTLNHVVLHGGIAYRCVTAHDNIEFNGTFTEPGVGSTWQTYWVKMEITLHIDLNTKTDFSTYQVTYASPPVKSLVIPVTSVNPKSYIATASDMFGGVNSNYMKYANDLLFSIFTISSELTFSGIKSPVYVKKINIREV